MNSSINYSFQPIGTIQSPFNEKFGIPRQPRLAPAIKSCITFNREYSASELLIGLEQASHLWIVFVFSECYGKDWKKKVRPPRLGGNEKLGVLATRTPFRPNPIGISAVKIEQITLAADNISIEVSGADLLNGTPILDIKPYIPYSDKIQEATHQFAESFSPLDQPIFFSAKAQSVCEQHLLATDEQLSLIIEQMLRCDPRPAYHNDPNREYGTNLYHWNIRWCINENRIDILDIHEQG